MTGRWVNVRPRDRVLIVTDPIHAEEAQILKAAAGRRSNTVSVLLTENQGRHVGTFFDNNEDIFDPYTAVIAATDYSLVTTRAAKRAIERHRKFLSLPLSTNDGRSMLAYDFLQMDTKKSRLMAKVIMRYLREAVRLRVTTPAGTDLTVSKRGRNPGFFNGVVRDGHGYSSASIETYVPVEENSAEGIMVLDGSLGYIGRPEEPTRIGFRGGRAEEIEKTPTGIRLAKYMQDYNDSRIYIAGEFGIGLNSLSQCLGRCYIEDESCYGTFHIGLGRNLALGGQQNASGHFDLVCLEPDIYADNRLLMQRGKIIVPEPNVY